MRGTLVEPISPWEESPGSWLYFATIRVEKVVTWPADHPEYSNLHEVVAYWGEVSYSDWVPPDLQQGERVEVRGSPTFCTPDHCEMGTGGGGLYVRRID